MTMKPELTSEAVSAVYARNAERHAWARRLLGRPLTLAEKILFAHVRPYDGSKAHDFTRLKSFGTAVAGPCGFARRHRTDGHPTVHAGGCSAGGGPVDRALRPPYPGAAGSEVGPAASLRRQPGGVRLPRKRVEEVRAGVLAAGSRHHPPGRTGELRVSGGHDHRYGLAHAQRSVVWAWWRSAWEAPTLSM